MTDLLALLPPGPPLILWDDERPVLAEQALEGLMPARSYQRPEPMHCAVAVADLVSDAGLRIDQLVHGEGFEVLHRDQTRVWGRARRDGVIGWVDQTDLKAGMIAASYRVASRDSVLPLNALVDQVSETITADHLAPIGEFAADLVGVAETYLGVPHLLGGRTHQGTDCSGLVQQALYACGRAGPRRADEQSRMGRAVVAEDVGRNDLVIWLAPDSDWSGHSALVIEAQTVIHATGHHGKVVIEPLAEVEARLTDQGFQSAIFRRL